MITKPMLACSESLTPSDLESLDYPVFVTPKLDGIRCLVVCSEGECVAFSRKLIEIPNCHIQSWAASHGISGMDGEIIIPGLSFHEIQSIVMSDVTLPLPINWKLMVFDWHQDRTRNYLQRLQKAKAMIDSYAPAHTGLLLPTECTNASDVQIMFDRYLRQGHEGLILRSDSYYKQGRSTRNEGLMLKMKTFEDAEAIVIDFIPEYANNNLPTKDRTGAAKRSSHMVNRTPKCQLGALVVRDGLGREFKIGSGFDKAQKIEIWNRRTYYRGEVVTYKYQSYGEKNLPRCPIFKGFRKD